MRIAIRGGRIIDPAHGRDSVADIFVAEEHVVAIGQAPDGFQADREINARGQIVCPGLIDLCARLREPGHEHKATIASESRAAASAGITTLVCPPDTDPVIDETAVVELIRRRAEASGYARVLTLGALTRDLQGQQLAEMAALKEAGCVGVSNASIPISNTLVLRRSLEYAATHDLTVFLSPIDPWLSANGCAHDGETATCLGLTGIPVTAETAAVAYHLALNEDLGVRLHCCRLSSARAVEMIAHAKARGMQVTADVSAHQLHLTEKNLLHFNTLCNVIPPLRSVNDKMGLRAGVSDGVLEAICSDHQPHEADAKRGPFKETEPGVSGLDTLLGLGLRLVEENALPLPILIARLTDGPARILGVELGTLGIGATADVCIFDPRCTRIVNAHTMVSQGHNSPFWGWELPGRVTHTFLAGRLVYEATIPI